MAGEGIEIYVRHAQKYGTEGVLWAAYDAEVPFSSLVKLQLELEKIDGTKRRRFQKETAHRLTIEQRVRRVLGIPDPEEAIA